MNIGVGSWIERRARVTPARVALVHGDVRHTYDELARRIRRLAHALRALGVQRGDRVSWLGENHPAFLELLFATTKLGAVLAPINHRQDSAAVAALLGDYSPAVTVIDSPRAAVPLPADSRRVVVGVDYEDLVARGSDGPIDEHVALTDLCTLHHTSGTSGTPKGIMLTHGNVTWNVVNVLSTVDLRADDVTVAIAPFFRTGGLGVNVLPVLFKGGTVVVPELPSPEAILDCIVRERVTVGFGNPDLLDGLTRAPRWPHADLSTIRLFMTGGTPVPERLLRTYLDRGIPCVQGYGLSEAAPLVLLVDSGSALRKIGSAGKPPLLVDVRVVRPDGSECTCNETGELEVHGPNVMQGYWKRPDETRLAIKGEGWLATGDAARIDEEGYVWIVDRVADAYEAAGHIVYPGDVERAVGSHPSVADVGVAFIGGLGMAFVVRTAGATVSEDELLEACRTRLPPYAVPASVRFVDALPRSSVGKLLRAQLR
jgi:fatty-acyl-CoA synthase